MDIFLYLLISSIFLVGLVGTILPALPGTPIIFLGILVHVIYFGINDLGIVVVIVLGTIALLAQIFDYLASAYGAKKLGSTTYGIIGSILGGIIGMILFSIVGLVIGVFAGATCAEIFFAKKDIKNSLKIGMGSVLGFLGGTIIKIILGVLMILIYLAKILT